MTKEQIKACLEMCSEYDNCTGCPNSLFCNGIVQLLKDSLERILDLEDDVQELEAIVDLRSKRVWYNKFVKEVFQKERRDPLVHPDFDYIYELYFKIAEENKRLTATVESLTKNDEDWRELYEKSQAKWEKAYDKLDGKYEKLKKKYTTRTSCSNECVSCGVQIPEDSQVCTECLEKGGAAR